MLALDLRSPVIVIGERNSILAEREMNPTREEGRARVFASLSLYPKFPSSLAHHVRLGFFGSGLLLQPFDGFFVVHVWRAFE
jgi:hypothetical protein